MDADEQDAEQPVRNLVLSVCDLKQHGDTPSSRCGAQAVTMATRMYLHGGCDERRAYGDLHLLEIEQMKWTELSPEGPAPPSRWGHTMQAYNADLVLFGGLVADPSGLLHDEAPGAVTPPPFAVGLPWSHTGTPDNSVYTLQTQSLQWQAPYCAGTPPSPRFCHSACVVDDLYVVFGGCAAGDFGRPLDDLHWLDLRSMQWTSPSCSGTAPSPRFAHKMIRAPEDQLLVFGGASGSSGMQAAHGTLYSFDLATSVWSTVQVAGTAPFERSFHTFDLVGKWAVAFAGSTATSISDLYILDVPNKRWARPLYEGQVSVRSHASSVLHDKLIVFGGVRDRVSDTARDEREPRISKKLFFLNILEVKGGVAEGDFKFKLVTVGDSGVGKSCLLTRFVQDAYNEFHVSTIGVDFKTVTTMVRGRLVKLQLWDTAGQERFSVVTGNYYRNSDGFVFVYDATNRQSFEHVDGWLSQAQQHHECGPNTIMVLVGNKSDAVGSLQVSEEEGRAKAEQMGAFFVATSAKTAANVDMAFLTAAQNLVMNRQKQKQQQKTASDASGGNPMALSRLGGPPPSSGAERGKCGCQGGGR